MIFTETPIPGAFLIDLEKRGDDRGFFARAFCEKEFAAHQLVTRFVQVNNSLSAQKGTLRGMHYQLHPGLRPSWCDASVGRFTISSSTYDRVLPPSDKASEPSCPPRTAG